MFELRRILTVSCSVFFALILIVAFLPNTHFLVSGKLGLIYLFIFLILVFIINNGKLDLSKEKLYAYSIVLFWLSYSIITILWAKNQNQVILHSSLIFIKFLLLFSLTQFINSQKKARFAIHLILIVFLAQLTLAFWEIITWKHLPVSWISQKGVTSFIPTGPFVNQNNFAWSILIITPYVLFSLNSFKRILYKIVICCFLLAVYVIFVVQSARIAILIFSVELISFFLFFTKKKNVSLFISVTIILLIILFTAVPRVVDLFTDTLAQSISSLFTESDSYHMKSIETRVELIKHSMTMFFESYLFGVGAGNFSDNMTFDRIYSTSGIAIPHNYFFEILATFGLVITVLWFLFIIYIGITLLIKNFGNEKSNIQLASGFAMILLVPASTLPSTIMLFFSHWIIIALSISLVKFNKTFLIKI